MAGTAVDSGAPVDTKLRECLPHRTVLGMKSGSQAWRDGSPCNSTEGPGSAPIRYL